MKQLVSLLLLVALNCQATTIDELAALLDEYRQFSAEFEQISFAQDGTKSTVVTGELAMAGQDTFYWRTNAPFAQVIVADSETLWVYDEDLLQVQVRPLGDALDTSPASILGGSATKLLRQFRVESGKTESMTSYMLTPRAEEDVTRQIILRFDDRKLIGLDIEDALGNRIQVTLTSINQSMPDPSYFIFTPPANVDVIYALGKQR